jgi:uncharacterized membrane protein
MIRKRMIGAHEIVVIGMAAVFFVASPAFLFTMIMALVNRTRGWIIAAVTSGILLAALIAAAVILAAVLVYVEAPNAA